ncbi:hypothetical protein AMTRI_Chr12g270830 [Amborella trichopoda]
MINTITASGVFHKRAQRKHSDDVQACQPATLTAVIGLARVYEHCQLNTKKAVPNKPRKIGTNQSSSTGSFIPIKRLSPAELSEWRAKGLCFNCNEKFGPGHHCKKLFLSEGIWPDEEEEAKAETNMEDEVPEIYLNAIYGAKAPQTMRVQGSLGQQRLNFLIDSSSTHNFLNNAIAQKMSLNPNSKRKFEVWLSMLGPITWDFFKLRRTFTLNGKEVSLQGLK